MALAPSTQVPLIEPHPVELDTELEKSLKTLENFLGLIGFGQYTVFGTAMSWLVFIILAVALPVLSIQIVYCSNCEKYEIKSFELEIMMSHTIVAAISLLCISHILRKYGVRKMLFVYHCHGHLTQFRNLCLQKIRVLSIVQLVGIVLCLNAAAKISHRAQGLGSVASRWHALISCKSIDGSFSTVSDSGGNSDVPYPVRPLSAHCSESDLESSDYSQLHMNLQFTSSMSSYQKRQAFVTYVQSNAGGFTIFGWMVDRMLINTIFFIELSLVFFVLGKTITITTR